MKRSPHGFTLIELLVVITIIGMLVGLLLPAVKMAREMGRRVAVQEQLNQLALACKAHAEKLNYFPSGGWGSNWVGNPDYGTGPDQPGGWIYQLMPYMDNDELHELGKGNSSLTAASNATRVSAALAILYCPTRRAASGVSHCQRRFRRNRGDDGRPHRLCDERGIEPSQLDSVPALFGPFRRHDP